MSCLFVTSSASFMESHPRPTIAIDPQQAVLECPACLGSCSPADKSCPACGFKFGAAQSDAGESVLDRTIHFDPQLRLRYTNAIKVELGSRSSSRHRFLWMAVNLALGATAVSVGGFMAYAMPFGFECGMIFVFVGALFVLNVYLTSDVKKDRVDGSCPNCGALCSITIARKKTSGAGGCQKCSKRFNYDGSRFVSKSAS
jgi:Zn finger protein HypA/HybF involved in hydrogenase expression